MQIISSGEDGVLMVWDLNKVPEDLDGSGKPRRRKARKRPSALTAQISPFKAYDRKFRPIYILYPRSSSEKGNIKLTSLSLPTHTMKYRVEGSESVEAQTLSRSSSEKKTSEDKSRSGVPLKEQNNNEGNSNEDLTFEESDGIVEKGKTEQTVNSEPSKSSHTPHTSIVEDDTAKDEVEDEGLKVDPISLRTIYKPITEAEVAEPSHVVQVTTDDGDVMLLRWEGFDFHKGEVITTELGEILSWGKSVHDGPIVTCVRSPFMQDLILTVGGRVMALWKEELVGQPLFWKYCSMGVTCGSWSPHRPCMFHVGRCDGSIEVWDLGRTSDEPVLVQSISGKPLTSLVEHNLPLYNKKSILGVADFNNSFRLLYFPRDYQTPMPNELQTLQDIVDREVYVRQTYIEWNESFIKSNAEELAKMKEKEEEAENLRRQAELEAEQEAQLRMKLEEDEGKRHAKTKTGNTLSDRFLIRLKQEREKQMQRVLMEKKRLNKSELIAKQQPIIMMKQMEKEKRKKQKEKIRQQQKIFDKTVAMLFPEVVEKAEKGGSRIDSFEAELMHNQDELMRYYDYLLPSQLRFVKENPFNKRLKWEKVFEEGMFRRNVLDFPLYLRQKRKHRFYKTSEKKDDSATQEEKKKKVGFLEDGTLDDSVEEEEMAESSEVAEDADEGYEETMDEKELE